MYEIRFLASCFPLLCGINHRRFDYIFWHLYRSIIGGSPINGSHLVLLHSLFESHLIIQKGLRAETPQIQIRMYVWNRCFLSTRVFRKSPIGKWVNLLVVVLDGGHSLLMLWCGHVSLVSTTDSILSSLSSSHHVSFFRDERENRVLPHLYIHESKWSTIQFCVEMR